ncbi:MAG TPA: ice-binding family protein [Bacillota bacterium]|nr:ice-binding family protein [Bacillota bacterium]
MKKFKTRRMAALFTALFLIVTTSFPAFAASPLKVELGTTSSFAILAGSAITNTGTTTISGDAGGDIGLFPGSAYDGRTEVTTTGAEHVTDGVASKAQDDLTTAYNQAANTTSTETIAADLGGRTLVSGVYTSQSSIGITGTLTLDGQGDPEAVFIFQAGSTLTTASGSEVKLINGARYCRVFWQVGSSATLGTNSKFVGHIFAMASITATTGVEVQGQLLARTGAVTLDTNTILNGICATTTLTVIKQVINDNTGTSLPANFSLHVKTAGASGIDVAGSPANGSTSGHVYTLLPGNYTVSEALAAGYTASYLGADASGNVSLAAGENKTVTLINNDIATAVIAPLINIVKTPSPSTINASSGLVTYTYTVTNPGPIALTDVIVTDDKINTVTYKSGDLNSDNLLQVTETWIYTSIATLTATTTNTATVKGTGNGMQAIDLANATVTVGIGLQNPPLINVVKTAAPQALVSGPGPVTYTYHITNPGPVELSNVTISDDKISMIYYDSGDVNADNLLQVTETWIYTGLASLSETTTNTVTVTGSANGLIATDVAYTTVTVTPNTAPAIQVVKTALPLSLTSTGVVTYTYQVTNPGVATLHNISIFDDKISMIYYDSGDVNADELLQIGETWIYTGIASLSATTTNTVTVRGAANGMIVSDTDIATVTVTQPVAPIIHLEKTASPLALTTGAGLVTYTYTVTNPGTVAMSDVFVSDDKISTIYYTSGDLNHDYLLQTDETWIYTAASTINTNTTNTAIAQGSANGITVTDQAVVTVLVTLPPVITTQTGGTLPITSSPWSTLMLVGFAMLMLGAVSWIFVRRYE